MLSCNSARSAKNAKLNERHLNTSRTPRNVQALVLLIIACTMMTSCAPQNEKPNQPATTQKEQTPKERCMAMYSEGKSLLAQNDPRGEDLMLNAIKLSEKSNDTKTAIGVSDEFAGWLFQQQRFAEAKNYYERVAKLAEEEKSPQWRAHALIWEVNCDQKMNKLEEADIGKLLEGIKIAPQSGEVTNAKLQLASTYAVLGKFDKAEETIKQNIAEHKEVTILDLLSKSQLNVCRGKLNESLKDLQAAQSKKIDGKNYRFWPDYLRWLKEVDPNAKEWSKISNITEELIDAEQYAKLEKFAEACQKDSRLSYRGLPRISAFYEGLLQVTADANLRDSIAYIREVEKWTRAEPKSQVAMIALADAYKALAWHAKFRGWHVRTNEDGWKGAAADLGSGLRTLDSASKMGEPTPHLFATKLDILLAQGVLSGDYNRAYREAETQYPSSVEILSKKAFFIQPKMRGRPGEFAEWLNKQADVIGGDNADKVYAWIVWNVDDQNLYPNIFKEYPALSWKRVKHGFDLLKKEFPNSPLIRGKFAQLGEDAGDPSVAAHPFDS